MGGRCARCGAHMEPPAATDAEGVQPADARDGLAAHALYSRGSVPEASLFWVFLLPSSSGILNMFRNLDLFPSSGDGETPTLVGPLETANLNLWTTYASITAAMYIILHLRKETDQAS